MDKAVDWAQLWRELTEMHLRATYHKQEEREGDIWRTRAREFDAQIRRRWAAPDSSRTRVVAEVQACPGATVVDIGAGTGAWAMLLSQHARHVTAVEPSAAMIEVMRENLAAAGITNVTIVQGSWPEVEVPEHDISLCAHAMYACPDLVPFVRRMEEVTRRTCFMLLRAPVSDGLMAQLAMRIWGQPHDSANFQIAYNVLLQMGIYANVLMEDVGLWEPWRHASMEEALADVKHRFDLEADGRHDDYLADMLRRHLVCRDGGYLWPRGVQSALVYWHSRGALFQV